MTNNISQEDLISSMVGQKVYKVFIEPWACGFSTNEVNVYIEANWILYDSKNNIIDMYKQDISERTQYNMWKILLSDISLIEITTDSCTNIKITFDNSLILIMHGNDDGMEDYSFQWFISNFRIVCNQHI